MRRVIFFLTLIIFIVTAPAGFALTLDLTSKGSSGTINGAIFQSLTQEIVAGTGLIDSFLRIQANGTEQGYNADAANAGAFEFDEKFGSFTHSLLLSDLQTNKVSVEGIDYYEFVLDINETANTPLLTMHQLEIYLTNTGSRPSLEYATLGTPIYDLDAVTDSQVELDYSNFAGSGRLDMIALIPTDVFGTDLTKNVVLFSAFGNPDGSDDGFEEWAAKTTGTFTAVPEPGTMVISSLFLIGAGFFVRRKLHRKA